MAISYRTILSDLVEGSLDAELVSKYIANNDYEDEAKLVGGSSVVVNVAGAPTVQDATGTIDYDTANDDSVTVQINQVKVAPGKISDVEKLQSSKGLLAARADNCTKALAKTEDAYVISKVVDAVTAANTLGTEAAPLQVTTNAQAMAVLRDLKTKLDKAEVPLVDRRIVCPPEFENLLLASTDTATALNTSKTVNDEAAVKVGFIGRLLGFDIFKSNAIDDGTILATHPRLNTKIEQYQGMKWFTDKDAPLYEFFTPIAVYGAGVVRPVSAKALVAFQ